MIVRAAALLALLWIAGFLVFALSLGRPNDDRPTDAIVVLTGGPGRLARGLTLLEHGRAKRLLVSGVGRTVKPHELAAANDAPVALFDCCVDLGREAVDTRSNGDEVARWVRRHHWRSLRLVTTDWHMARARFELTRSIGPGVEIVRDAVPSSPALVSLVTEYDKYLLRRIAVVFGI